MSHVDGTCGADVKAQFLTPLRVEYLGDGYWTLFEDMAFYSARLKKVIQARKGFVTDFESIRRIPVAYWLFKNRAVPESVIHDWLWRKGLVGQLEADRIFMEAMEARGKWWITRALMGGTVMAAGPFLYGPRPGCMDFRGCSRNSPLAPRCEYCERYDRHWEQSIMTLEEYHESLEMH